MSYRFVYRIPVQDAANALLAAIAKEEFKSIVGEVSPSIVKLHKRVPWWSRRSLEPIFVGRFVPDKDGSALVGRFRTQWDAIVFLAVIFAFLAWRWSDAFFGPEARIGYVVGWRDKQLQTDTAGIAFTLLMCVFLWAMGACKRKAIVAAIRSST